MSEEQNRPKLPEVGTYKSRRAAAIIVKEADQGALCAYVPYQLLGSSIAHIGEHVLVLGKQDGTLMQATWENLAAIFPEWQPREDGQLNPYDLCAIPLTPEGTPEFLAKDCFHDEYPAGSGKLKFKIQWMNPLGSNRIVTPEEQAATESKWGSKFKLAASIVKKVSAPAEQAPAKAAPVAETPAAPAEPAPKKAPGRKAAPKATAKEWKDAEELYAAFLKKQGTNDDPKKEEAAVNDIWYPACDKVCGVNVPPTTQEHFAKLAEEFGV